MSFFGYGKAKVPDVVQAGDPVLHEPAEEVKKEDIGSVHIEKTINDMVATMRNAPGVGLAAPQIGVPLQIIVLEDTTELMSYTSVEECEAQHRYPFDLLVCPTHFVLYEPCYNNSIIVDYTNPMSVDA
jgi:peptide deformylase